MVENDKKGFDKALNKKEYQNVHHIMEQFNIKPDKVVKQESIFKIRSHHKYYCLNKVKRSDKKALRSIELANYLKENNYKCITEFYKTKNDKNYVKDSKDLYYLTEWIQGRRCEKSDLGELKKCVKLLADFHICSKGFFMKGFGSKSNINKWPAKFSEEKQDLLLFKRLIESKKVKTPFDCYYYNNIDIFIKYFDLVMELLNKSHYIDYCNKALFDGSVCFSNYLIKDVMYTESGDLYITNLKSCTYGVHIYDLAIFIRRILNLRNYRWDFSIASELINEYCKANTINNDEFRILLAFIVFPHKFWKLGKKKYVKHRKLSEERFISKLSKIVMFENERVNFINQFMQHYCSE
jgi:CotS family spore coat protein